MNLERSDERLLKAEGAILALTGVLQAIVQREIQTNEPLKILLNDIHQGFKSTVAPDDPSAVVIRAGGDTLEQILGDRYSGPAFTVIDGGKSG
jgi:hypothetical protein